MSSEIKQTRLVVYSSHDGLPAIEYHLPMDSRSYQLSPTVLAGLLWPLFDGHEVRSVRLEFQPQDSSDWRVVQRLAIPPRPGHETNTAGVSTAKRQL
jgi:hypothetical protein